MIKRAKEQHDMREWVHCARENKKKTEARIVVTNAEACRQANSNTARIWHELEHIKSIKCNAFHSDNSFIFIQISYDICAWMDSNIKYSRNRVARSNAHTAAWFIEANGNVSFLFRYYITLNVAKSKIAMFATDKRIIFFLVSLFSRHTFTFSDEKKTAFFKWQQTTTERKMWNLSCTLF